MLASELAQGVGGKLFGADIDVVRVSSFGEADPSSLVFAMTPDAFAQANASKAGTVIAGGFVQEPHAKSKSVIVHAQPKLAFARAAKLLTQSFRPSAIHPSAVVDSTAMLADGVSIEPYAVIGARVRIGLHTHIGAHAVISDGCTVGEDCTIHSHVSIYPGTKIGNRVVVHSGAVLGSDGFGYVQDPTTGAYEQFPQLGRLLIEDDVEIGANTTVDRGALEVTVLRRGTKLDNLVHIAHNVDVGQDVVIAAQTGISGSSTIEDRAVIAGQVGIADHVRIESGAILGAQCGVPSGKVIRGPGVLFWGTPARPIKEYLKQLAVLARLAKGK